MKNIHRTINITQVFTLIVILSLLILAAGFVYYKHEENIIRQSKYEELKAIADLKEIQIIEWIKQRKVDAVITSKSPFFIDGVEKPSLAYDTKYPIETRKAFAKGFFAGVSRKENP